MAFNAPTLFTEIDTVNYQYEIDSNFRLLQRSLTQIQNEFGVTVQNSAPTNLILVDIALGANGVMGVDSWAISFEEATDGYSVIISHPIDPAISYAVLDGSTHQSNTQQTRDLNSIVPAGDGTYRVVFGITSVGIPSVEYVFENAESATDETSTLTIWSFTVDRSGSTFTVRDLRREAPVLLARSSWDEVMTRETVVNIGVEGALGGSPANLQPGLVVPWDCEVVGAWFNLGSAPSGGSCEVKLRIPETDEDVLNSSVTWTDGVDGVLEGTAQDPTRLLAEGTFVQPELVTANAAAADLTVTVLLRRIYFAIL